ncbi:MAG: FIG018329: 1-acyl-sn-glycerol-3-phosphate acyltransferase [uncultured Acetobacteraceae bacterium]|uniref:FIG018329: 1-acyl-sn-glycerol-3-phosphate acyltransferase n=1 Tax=uncultured Acetobacteraceae bacterium TaxID=169975 RepID=A0A6J4HH79_9PROT|nr:MAG: FIG018329: 1-acyl-sn-glycerol-3-phosphate acyltransferase [uncultured Acetobacteraceae bacterium]
MIRAEADSPSPHRGRRRAALLGRAAGRLYYAAAFYAALAVFGASCLLWSLPASLLHRVLPRRFGEPIGQFGIMAGFRWGLAVMRLLGVVRVDLSALDALRDERSVVVASNHPTMMDAVLLISRLPRVVCITKASLWDSPFLGGGVRLAGYVRNDAPLPMIRRAAEAVREGRQLMVFPEGSRTARPPFDRFSRGFAVMARAAGAPVQTVLIEADSPYLRKGWPLLRRPDLPVVFRVRLGERFTMGRDPEAFVAGLENYFRRELRAGVEEEEGSAAA